MFLNAQRTKTEPQRLFSSLRLAVSFLAISLSALSDSARAEQDIVTMCVDDWPPHIIHNGEKKPGPMTLAATKIFELAGDEVKLVWAPWQLCIENVKLGIWDSSLGWSKTPERESQLLFSTSFINSYHLFMHLKEKSFDWKKWEDLKGLNIGVTKSYSYGETFEKAKNKNLFLLESAASDADNLKKLLKGQIDLFPLNKNTAWPTAKKHLSPAELDQIELHPRPLSENRTSHVIFSKTSRSERLIKDFNDAAEKLKQSGEFSKFFDYLRR